jgi:DNA polymerase IV (DinB-like DNA polymerase)
MSRVILHVDMDSFYAQVEEREDPGIKGKPVVVCMFSGRTPDSGAVAAANYAAREYGIKAGIPIARAKRLNPDAVFLPARRDFYGEVSERVMEILRGFADAFEQVSIDEAYLDVTGRAGGDMDRGIDLARRIKAKVKDEESLTCSIGVGPNKLIAKMAANVQKPDGLTAVRKVEVRAFLEPLAVKELYGVGGKTAERLREMGVETIGGLSRMDASRLMEAFGKARGRWLYEASRGMDDSPVEERGEKEQIGRIATLKEDTREMEDVIPVLDSLAEEVFARIREKGLRFRAVTVRLVTEDLKGHTKSRTLPFPVQDLDVMKRLGRELLDAFLEENPALIRRAGIRVSEFSKAGKQKTLMEF